MSNLISFHVIKLKDPFSSVIDVLTVVLETINDVVDKVSTKFEIEAPEWEDTCHYSDHEQEDSEHISEELLLSGLPISFTKPQQSNTSKSKKRKRKAKKKDVNNNVRQQLRNKYIDISQNDPKPSHIQVSTKYWDQRYRLMSKYDHGILLDDESWYSITPEIIANYITKRCQKASKKHHKILNVALDGFSGCGGNSISLATAFEQVICVDIDLIKTQYCYHNATIYGVEHKMTILTKNIYTVFEDILVLQDAYRNQLMDTSNNNHRNSLDSYTSHNNDNRKNDNEMIYDEDVNDSNDNNNNNNNNTHTNSLDSYTSHNNDSRKNDNEMIYDEDVNDNNNDDNNDHSNNDNDNEMNKYIKQTNNVTTNTKHHIYFDTDDKNNANDTSITTDNIQECKTDMTMTVNSSSNIANKLLDDNITIVCSTPSIYEELTLIKNNTDVNKGEIYDEEDENIPFKSTEQYVYPHKVRRHISPIYPNMIELYHTYITSSNSLDTYISDNLSRRNHAIMNGDPDIAIHNISSHHSNEVVASSITTSTSNQQVTDIINSKSDTTNTTNTTTTTTTTNNNNNNDNNDNNHIKENDIISSAFTSITPAAITEVLKDTTDRLTSSPNINKKDTSIQDSNKIDIILLSPPWGGPSYTATSSFNLRTQLTSGDGFHLIETAAKICENIIYIIPRNTSHKHLRKLQRHVQLPCRVEEIYLHSKHKLTVVYFGHLLM